MTNKAKILRLCNEIEDYVQQVTNDPSMANDVHWLTLQKVVGMAQAIGAEISEKPKTNGDRIRQMTDDELAEHILFMCKDCEYCGVCLDKEVTCQDGFLKWLRKEVSYDAAD